MNAVDLIVEDEAWDRLEGKSALAETAIAAAQCEIDDILPGVIAILLTGDDAVAQLNKSFRGKEGPTNVLSFPASEHADNHLGDVALAWGVVEREAADKRVSVEDHLRHLIVHGFLHLQGYDHQDDDEAEHMEDLERRALARLGVSDPYAE
ncbi:MAG: rRNA maturation RNase YbeY [Alphaproteobacteria bacterium]|uniref:rRNA maturation RNase YbeY n=1 Tax=Maricaulis alexandrii TaxID=2570354 RepID=UPI00110A02D2|nr:rRNA maturation RNase YbeY [Maricaulis alexandrii]MCR9266236.1 rRNA maturation RNase YbeY [Alphaproteobacteria bacterium]